MRASLTDDNEACGFQGNGLIPSSGGFNPWFFRRELKEEQSAEIKNVA